MNPAILKNLILILFALLTSLSQAQWEAIMQNVLIVDIAVSPDYQNDQLVYVLDNQNDIYRSTDGGDNWDMVYQALDPNIPAEKVIGIVVSPDFKNDHRVIMIHLDGSAETSYDRGETWEYQPVPDGTTSLVFSPDYINDQTVLAATGGAYPARFYRSLDKGTTWAETANPGNTGFYTRLWNTMDPEAPNNLAIQYDINEVYLSDDGGYTWVNASDEFSIVWDVAFSNLFSADNTLFLATAKKIFKNTSGGDYFDWINTYTNQDALGITLAISSSFDTDQTIFAAVDQAGVIRSMDGGLTWESFSGGLDNFYPISLSMGGNTPIFSLFMGTQNPGGLPDRLWRYRIIDDIHESDKNNPYHITVFPNPVISQLHVLIQAKQKGKLILQLFDSRAVCSWSQIQDDFYPGEHVVTINTEQPDLSPGLYYLVVSSGSYQISKKILIW